MPSAVDLAKRELVKVLKELAAKYSITFAFTLTRESSDEDVIKAFRRVSLKVHPDKKAMYRTSRNLMQPTMLGKTS